MNEQWRDVVGYEGLYQVSDMGRVRSIDRVVPDKRIGQQRLKGKFYTPFRGVSILLLVYLKMVLNKLYTFTRL